MITIRQERPGDIVARESVLDAAFGPARFAKSSERLREGRAPAAGLAFVAVDDGRVVGTVRLWSIEAGEDRAALLLGPLAVTPAAQGRGIGARLLRHALAAAAKRGHAAILLVGDAPYYGRFGFSSARTADLRMPGPYDPARLLAREIRPGALDDACGLITAAGEPPRRSTTPPAVVRTLAEARESLPRAA